MKTIIDVRCNVIRFTPLGQPTRWCEGDYTATLSDGTKRNATYSESLAFIGLPDMPNIKVEEIK